jgi:hypothetical protein
LEGVALEDLLPMVLGRIGLQALDYSIGTFFSLDLFLKLDFLDVNFILCFSFFAFDFLS